VRSVRFLGEGASAGVPTRKRHVELSVARPLEGRGAPGAVARLSATFEVTGDGAGPSTAELGQALEELVRDLEGVLGPSVARADRPLEELVETYRPRQRELVDLLLADGEITPAEHASLAATLGDRPGPGLPQAPARTPEPAKLGETPIAAVPIAAEPKLPPSRPVPELLRTFQIASLRQAGAVRARRQISFAEYMALKRHFEAADAPGDGKPTASE
jgi:hypothetical protein